MDGELVRAEFFPDQINPNGWNEMVYWPMEMTTFFMISGIRVEMPDGARAIFEFDNFIVYVP